MAPRLVPVREGTRPSLSDQSATARFEVPSKKEMLRRLHEARLRVEALAAALGAEQRRALLVILQGRDASGKDGTIKAVFGDLNPSYCQVSWFKRPTPLELRHDFLWRVHRAVPPAGVIGVWNRSHYEDVLVVRVHRLVPEELWRKRYQHINEFERMLTDHGVVILKFLLHVSREEQRKQLEERLRDPTKNWKFELGDLQERDLWDQYTEAYRDVLEKTSTSWAPWYVVPGDKKAVRDLLVAQVVAKALEDLNPQYPRAPDEVLAHLGKIR